MRVLFRDERVLAADKQPGVLTVPGRAGPAASGGPTPDGEGAPPASQVVAAGSFLDEVRAIAPGALPVHRLDRFTSGVVLFALDAEAHRALSLSFEGRRSEKAYLLLCRGDLAAPQTCSLALAEQRGGMRVARESDKRAQPSETSVVPLERFGAFTWVLARPRTGRRHQIRVHLAALGHPLALDPRYGDGRPLRRSELTGEAAAGDPIVLDRTPLHAQSIRVPHPSGKGWLAVEAPLPEDLSRCLDALRAARRQR